MLMQYEDEELIERYLEGDDRALGVLVDRYLKPVYNLVFRLTGDAQAADDITQESFVKAWKHIRSFRRGESFKAWLFRIARNTAIDWLRRKKDVPLSTFDDEEGGNFFEASIVDEEPLQDEMFARAEESHAMAELLDALAPQYREVVMLRHTSNLTFEEIGDIVHRPLHTVKSQYRRALIILRGMLEGG